MPTWPASSPRYCTLFQAPASRPLKLKVERVALWYVEAVSALSRQKRWSRRGVSLLLELLLGLTLVSLAVLSIFSLFPAADRSVALADRTTQASTLARSLLDQQLQRSYGELSTDPASYLQGETSLVHTRRHGQALDTRFRYRVEITQPDLTHEVKRILVTVSWNYGSREEKVVLESRKGSMW